MVVEQMENGENCTKKLSPFPCNGCGKCCEQIRNSPQTAYLDRGDGTCRHFDEQTRRCLIYQNRPLVCRVEDYYRTHLSHIYEWEEFVKLNLAICEQL